MIRLETVEDFEKARKALDNPDSKLSEYCMYEYGYCSFCKSYKIFDATAYETSQFGENKITKIFCHGCKNHFFLDHGTVATYIYYGPCKPWQAKGPMFEFVLNIEPRPQTKEEREFFSRINLRKLFNDKLEVHIKAFKSEQRILSSKIRRLAKLRA